MLDPFSLAGAGLGIVSGIAGLFGGGNKKLEELLKQDPTYTANPQAASRLGLAQSLLNARSPGSAYAEANIYGNQANTMGNIERNATDASQALALGAASQGQTNKSFLDLGNQEAQDYQRRYGNLVGAQEGVIQEGDKVYQDKVRRFNDMAQIRGQQNANTQNAWNGLSNLGFGVMNYGLAGGFKGMFGNGSGNRNQSYGSPSITLGNIGGGYGGQVYTPQPGEYPI